MASNAAAPFWRSAGMTYITYSNLCANLVRNCLKEPYKSEALTREKVHYSIGRWVDGKPQKPSKFYDMRNYCPLCLSIPLLDWLNLTYYSVLGSYMKVKGHLVLLSLYNVLPRVSFSPYQIL
ncbi:hypothetical protein RND71_029061 [Anisodus tanguticus]|uniref:ATP synthase subunit epsilon, mitochondrial n=1 Tax=Anisodus tanguticus TaxID=243964 RepID=A0AAE1UYF4_9SOLA|nr:hypothetical protein RND71_029061 [Anisodus tanguticus]